MARAFLAGGVGVCVAAAFWVGTRFGPARSDASSVSLSPENARSAAGNVGASPSGQALTEHALSRAHAQAIAPIGFDPPEIDLGQQPWFSKLPFEAEFHNGGDQPVTVAAVTTSCGCAVVDSSALVNQVIAPGDSLVIPVSLNVEGRVGEQHQDLRLMLTSGVVFTARVRYDGFATYTVRPGRVDFGRVSLDGPPTSPATPDSAPGSDVQDRGHVQMLLFASASARLIERPQAEVPWIVASFRERSSTPGTLRETEVYVGLDLRNLPVGRSQAQLWLSTDDPNRPRFPVLVSVEAVQAIRVVPAHLFLRANEGSVARMFDEAGRPLTIAGVQSEDSGVQTDIAEQGLSVVISLARAIEGPVRVQLTDSCGRRANLLVSAIE